MSTHLIDRRCPACGQQLQSNMRTIWCENPACSYGIAETIPFLFNVRADGWPLCPICGEDELWSPLAVNGSSECPRVQAFIDAGLICYRCGEILEPRASAEEPHADISQSSSS